jgi:hypothetical protein
VGGGSVVSIAEHCDSRARMNVENRTRKESQLKLAALLKKKMIIGELKLTKSWMS